MTETSEHPPHPHAPTASVAIVGHRGLSHFAPENTPAALDAAIEAGLEGVEIDLRASRDGIPFLVHDPRLERVATRSERVDALDAAALTQIEVTLEPDCPDPSLRSQRLTSFESAYVPRAASLRWFAEVKFDARCVDEVARIWKALPPTRGSACMSFDRELCRRARARCPAGVLVARIHQEAMEGGPLREPLVEQAVEDQLDAIALWHRHIDIDLVRQAHDAGLQVFAWTINALADVDAALRAGVDVIMTDGPPTLLSRFGKRTPGRNG